MVEPSLRCWKDSTFLKQKSSLISDSYRLLRPIIVEKRGSNFENQTFSTIYFVFNSRNAWLEQAKSKLERDEVQFRKSEEGKMFCCAIEINAKGFHEFFMNRMLFFGIHHLCCVTGINLVEIIEKASASDLEGFRSKYNRMIDIFDPVMSGS